jgi:alkylhydroperoxidase/carboxymuconolactone decarboxylase family protein YurZ
LRKLTVRDDRYIGSILAADPEDGDVSGLEGKTSALVTLGALIAVDAAPPSYMSAVEHALASGATVAEVVGTLIAVMPVVGTARVVSAAPNLGLALGYDVSSALEGMDREGAEAADG